MSVCERERERERERVSYHHLFQENAGFPKFVDLAHLVKQWGMELQTKLNLRQKSLRKKKPFCDIP